MDNQVGAACLIKHTDMNAPTLRRPQRILNEADEDLEEAALITEEPRQGRVRWVETRTKHGDILHL